MRNWLAVLAAAASAPACYSKNAEYPCDSDTQCVNGTESGTCVQGFCAYTSSDCPNGKYGDSAGNKSGTCVGDTGTGSDAGSDTVDAPKGPPPDAAPVCYGSSTSIVKVCLDAAPTAELKVENTTMTIDTDTSTRCATNVVSGGTGYCVVAATDITLNASLRGTGNKPLVLIASGSITGTTVDAVIDVSSKRSPNESLGAGHDATTCNAAATAPKTKGGGAGGSFLQKGGDGGNGQNNTASGGTAGNVTAANTITSLRGGCIGQDGEGSAGFAGHGGGAIYLIANTKIEFPGTVYAGGEGGLGATGGKGGGGGAGTGGMIGFDAPIISIANGVYANGGGGGEGISQNNNSGDDGSDAGGATAASGGSKTMNVSGGDGGAGSSDASMGKGIAGSSGQGNNAGGGGGGGGVGFIKAPASANFNGKVYPAPTP